MSNEFPLYPELSEAAKSDAQLLINHFKNQMEKVCEETLSKLYTDIIPYIESDGWINYRNELLDGLRNYSNRKVAAAHDFAKIRGEIFKEFREQLIPDLNQDLLEEIESLKSQLKYMQEVQHYR